MTTNGRNQVPARSLKALGAALGVVSMVIGVLYGINLLGKEMTLPEGFVIVFPLLLVLCGGWLVGDTLFGTEKR